MGRPTIRVSEWAAEELRRRAAEEGRTMVSVLDRLLGRGLAPLSHEALMGPAVTEVERVRARLAAASGRHDPRELKYDPEDA